MVVYGASYNYSDTTLVLATSDTTSNTCTNTTTATSLQQIPAYNCTSTSNSTSTTINTITKDTFISCIHYLYYYKYCVAATFNAIVYDNSNHNNIADTYNQKNLVIMKNNLSAVPMSKILNNTYETNEKTAMMMSPQNITTILNLMHHRTCEHHLQILLQQQMIRDVMCTKMPPTVVCLLITEIAITLLMRLLKESPSQAC
jgi:hypothetical protein